MLVVVLIALTAIFVPLGAQAQGKEGHVAMAAGSIDHLEPGLWYFASTWRLAFATCTPLVTFPDQQGEDGKQVVRGLAELPEVSADGLTYTFTLKPGVKFADGKEITGEDIKTRSSACSMPDAGVPGDRVLPDARGRDGFCRRQGQRRSAALP